MTASLDDRQPDGPHPDEIVAMPELRPELVVASDERLADVLDAFDVSATYSKAERWIKLSATITAELIPSPRIARAGFEQTSAMPPPAYRIVESAIHLGMCALAPGGAGGGGTPRRSADVAVLTAPNNQN